MYRHAACVGLAIGDDVHIYILTLGAIIIDDVRGVIQREVHDRWIILIDLNDQAMCLWRLVYFRSRNWLSGEILGVTCRDQANQRERGHGQKKRQSAHSIPPFKVTYLARYHPLSEPESLTNAGSAYSAGSRSRLGVTHVSLTTSRSVLVSWPLRVKLTRR